MDSDDYIEPESLEELYDIAETNSTDCIIFKMINFDDETGEKYTTEYYEMEFLSELVGDNVFSPTSSLKNIQLSTMKWNF